MRRSQRRGAFPIDPEMLSAFACVPFDPAPLESKFAAALMLSDEDPRELEDMFRHIVIPKTRVTDAMVEIAERLKQHAKRFAEEDLQSMFDRWQSLQPALVALLELQRRYPATQLTNALQFLTPEYVGIVRHLELHLPTIEAHQANSSKYKAAKHSKRKAMLLAAAVVAKEFGVAESYCLQRLESKRREDEGRLRKAKVRPVATL